MSIVKKYSTGSIGNTYPDHSDRGNPNTKGLDSDNRLGIEAYIEEDYVVASSDNRPLKNLVNNDITLENNLADVASEVDTGVFLNKYEDFEIEIRPAIDVPNPLNENETINVTPLRIKSGSSIINGKVSRIGQQKIIYFLRKDDEDSILFPDYSEDTLQVQINDEDYFGIYEPVYDTVSDGLPDNFINYSIKIINIDSNGVTPTKTTVFYTYRDWEDVIPLAAEDAQIYDEEILFNSDENYGQFSEGYRLDSNGVPGTIVSTVDIRKNIVVKDELFMGSEFVNNGGVYESDINTQGLFFDDIQLQGQNTLFTKEYDIQDAYVTQDNRIYFITRDKSNKYIFLKTTSSTQIQARSLNADSEEIPMGLKAIDNYLFIYGTDGLLKTLDLNLEFTVDDSFKSVSNFSTLESVRNITVWDNKIFIASDVSLWYTDRETFDPEGSTFIRIDANSYVKDLGNNPVIDHINVIIPTTVGYYTESSLESNIKNLLINPSFELGGINNKPTNWNTSDITSTTLVINSQGNIGNYKATLDNTGSALSVDAYQDYEPYDGLTLDDFYTFSVYLKSVTLDDVKLIIEEYDSLNTVVKLTELLVTTTNVWERYSISHKIFTSSSTKIRVKILTESTNIIQIDNTQLEIGNVVNPYTENFNYLFIGFKKLNSNKTDPPYALIDTLDKYRIKYTNNVYGDIPAVNDAFYNENNSLYFACDCQIFSMNFLNETDEYDRVSISRLFSNQERIEKFETINKFRDKIYFGGTIKNQVIGFKYITDTEIHDIVIEDINGDTQESLTTLLGGYTKFKNDNGTYIEFKTTESCLETKGNTDYLRYIPGSNYYASITIDRVYEGRVVISSPSKNNGPWTLEQIYSQIIDGGYIPENNNVEWIDPTTSIDSETDWRKVNASSKIIDGFYSFASNNLQTHIRGDVHKMVLQEGNEDNFYIVRGSQIFKSKFDSNLIKNSVGDYISYEPTLNEENSLQLGKTKSNQEVIFTDNTYNRFWIDLPLTEGYNLLNRNLRVKTNLSTEVGYVEGKDYFIDYENGKIIRIDVDNVLDNTEFKYETNNKPADWTYITLGGNVSLSGVQRTQVDSFSEYCVKMYVEPLAGKQEGVFYQIFNPQDGSVSVGQTYTFSIYLRSDTTNIGKIRLSELNSNGSDDYVFEVPPTIYNINYSESIWSFTSDEAVEWKRFVISHTVDLATSGKLRVEIYHEDSYQLFISKPQLERNPVATDFVVDRIESRIDPDAHVWVDFIERKDLVDGVDYEFDTVDRKIKLMFAPNATDYLFLEYKYEKIFNYYDLGDSIPQTTITDYSENDDYFLYKNEGRIFAINQMFAMLSLEQEDHEDALLVSYKYHYPRIDVIKIRNTPDSYGNFLYLVKGEPNSNNPYRPYDIGQGLGINGEQKYYEGVQYNQVVDIINNQVLYEINVTNNNYNKNDIYDRRIYVDARFNKNFNISLYPETLAYFPFQKDFNSTNGFSPLNAVENSKIVPIIKYYSIVQQEEVGAWSDSYQLSLRTKMPYAYTPSDSVYVDPISGNDNNSGSGAAPFRTINKAKESLYYNSESDHIINIVILNQGTINENVEINHNFPIPVGIFAETFSYWMGALKNDNEIRVQGIWFTNSDIYPNAKLNMYYCTYENTSLSLSSPQFVNVYNSEVIRAHNSFIRVNEALTPSPFVHPYMKNKNRDDGIEGIPSTIATSDNESIHPDDEIISNVNQTSGYYFENCLIYESTDYLVDFDTEKDWSGSFRFNYCSIVDNKNLFSSDKYGLTITYENSILYRNGEQRGSDIKQWDTNSSIQLDTCFIDFSKDADASESNFKEGSITGQETCIGGEGEDPGFISIEEDNYYLKSTSRGFDQDSICLNASKSGTDLGVYNESREQTEKDIPKKLRNYVAFLNEGIVYPITMNSEKITITMEFKPTGNLNQPGVVFDTRSAEDDEDYIVIVYNNNDAEDHTIEANQPDPSAPYRFRIILKNKETSYSVISPIEILTDEEFAVWHRLTLVVNYENILNIKSGYADYDKQQNIINFYHNNILSVESYIKYDLNRDKNSELLPGRGNEKTNAWDYNNLNQFITLAADYNGDSVMKGYYTELRIDNRFIDRKQFELWDNKIVPFNDPLSYVNQAPLTKSLDSKTLNEYWPLKDEVGISAKGNVFKEGSSWRYYPDNSERAWFIGGITDNELTYPVFEDFENAVIKATSILDFAAPIELEYDWLITTAGSTNTGDNAGFAVDITNSNVPNWIGARGYQELGLTGKTGISTTSLADGTTYNFSIAINGGASVAKTVMVKQEVRAYQELGLSNISPTSSTGLANNTVYYYKTTLNGTIEPTERSITIPTGTLPTYANLLPLLDANDQEIDFEIVNGDIRAYNKKNPSTSIQLSAGTTGISQQTRIGIPGDNAGSLNEDYWTINTANDSNKYFVWYNIPIPAMQAIHTGTTNLYSGYNWSGNTESFIISYSTSNVPITFNKSYYNLTQIVDHINDTLTAAGITLVNAYSSASKYLEIRTDNSGSSNSFTLSAGSPNALVSLGLTPGTYYGQNPYTPNQPTVSGSAIAVSPAINSTAVTVLSSTAAALPSAQFTTTQNAGTQEISTITLSTNHNVDNYDGTYFKLSTITTKALNKDYYIWFNSGKVEKAEVTINNNNPHEKSFIFGSYVIYLRQSGTTAPFVPPIGKTTITVEYIVGVSTTQLATSIAGVIESTVGATISAYAVNNVVSLRSNSAGNIDSAQDVNTGFTIVTTQDGRTDSDNPIGRNSKYDLTIDGVYNSIVREKNTDALYYLDASTYYAYTPFDTPSGSYYITLDPVLPSPISPTVPSVITVYDPKSAGGPLEGSSRTRINVVLGVVLGTGNLGPAYRVSDTDKQVAEKIANKLKELNLIKSSSFVSELPGYSVLTYELAEMGDTKNYPVSDTYSSTATNPIIITSQQTTVGNSIKNVNLIGKNIVEVDVKGTVAYNVATVSAALNTKINALAEVNSSVASNVITVTNVNAGNVADPTIEDLPVGTLTFATTTPGINPYITVTNTTNGICTPATIGNIVGGTLSVARYGVTSSDLFDNLNGFVSFDAAVPGTTAGLVTYSMLIDALNSSTAGQATWALTGSGDVRCSSLITSRTSNIVLTRGTTSDLFAAIPAPLNEASVPGYEKVVLYNMEDVKETFDYLFRTGTNITWRINNSGMLEFFTKDYRATSITGNLFDDHSKLGFVNQITSGYNAVDNFEYNLGGSTTDTIYPNLNVVLYSDSGITLRKFDQSADAKIYSKPVSIITGKQYVYSLYVHSEIELTVDNVEFLNNNVENTWQIIEKINGNWYKLESTFSGVEDAINVGILVDKSYRGELTIDSMQLEEGSISSPFIEDITNENNVLIINNSLVSKDFGTIYFRFKPKFDFYEPKKDSNTNPPKIIFEMLGIDGIEVNLETGIRCQYYFSEEKNRGILETSINGENVKWELELVDRYWDKWHSIAIIYDFKNKRYSLWYDYFNYISEADTSLPDVTSDLYIGRGYPTLKRSWSGKSADILVKDIIILSSTISDSEVKNWIQSYEFYNNSFIIRSIEDVERRLEQQRLQLEDLSSLEVLSRLEEVESKVDQYEESNYQQEQKISANTNDIANNTTDIDIINTTLGQEVPREGVLGDILNLYNEVDLIKGPNWSGLPGADLHTLREDVNINSNLITNESHNRSIEIGVLESDLASNDNGKGASMIGIEDSGLRYASSTVENALIEIDDRIDTNTANIATNSSDIAALDIIVSTIDRQLQFITDGTDGSSTSYDEAIAAAGINVWNIGNALAEITTSTTDGDSGADKIAATAVGTGTATTVQGILEELYLNSGGSGTASMQVAYNGGSTVSVGTTNVVYTMAATKSFTLADGTDTSKFKITAGTGLDSVKIATSGGVDLSSTNQFNITSTGSSITVNGEEITITTAGSTGTGDIRLIAENDIIITGSVIPSVNNNSNLGDTTYNWNNIFTNALIIGNEAGLLYNVPNLQLTYDEGVTFYDIIHDGNLATKVAALSISGSGSLDDAYENGSSVTVDTADVDFNLSAGRDFRIFDGTDASKFVVTAGSGLDSVKIDTTGGVDIDANAGITISAGTNITNVDNIGMDGLGNIVLMAYGQEADQAVVALTDGRDVVVSASNNITIGAFGTTEISSLTSININMGSDNITMSDDGNISIFAKMPGTNPHSANITFTGGTGIDITASGTMTLSTTFGDSNIVISSDGAISFDDNILTSAINLSETGTITLNPNFINTSQTDFNWTRGGTAPINPVSIIGAINANRSDIYQYVELIGTQGAGVGVTAGANLIGVNGISNITPTSKTLGADSTLQQMLEGLAANSIHNHDGEYVPLFTVDSDIIIVTTKTIGPANISITAADELRFGDSRIQNLELSDVLNTTLPNSSTSIVGAINSVNTKIENLLVPSTSGAPSDSPAVRTVRFDSTTNKLYIYNGTSWVSTTLA